MKKILTLVMVWLVVGQISLSTTPIEKIETQWLEWILEGKELNPFIDLKMMEVFETTKPEPYVNEKWEKTCIINYGGLKVIDGRQFLGTTSIDTTTSTTTIKPDGCCFKGRCVIGGITPDCKPCSNDKECLSPVTITPGELG